MRPHSEQTEPERKAPSLISDFGGLAETGALLVILATRQPTAPHFADAAAPAPIAKRHPQSHPQPVSVDERKERAAQEATEAQWLSAREELVRTMHEIVSDSRVLSAFRRVPRHLFVPEAERRLAYRDCALPIGFGQTISQPSMIAIMLSALDVQPSDRVLEIGGGSGYAAALLAELAAEVYTLEIVPELSREAATRLAELGYDHAHVIAANGREGLAEHAPYSKILVSAGSHDVPEELARQLAPGGSIAIPVGSESSQTLLVGHKGSDGELSWERSVACIFVPLVARR